jgi:predicted Zn-dependent protease
LPFLEREVQLHPAEPLSHFNLAYSYLSLMRPKDCLKHARLGVAAEPDNPAWWQKLAKLLARLRLEAERAEVVQRLIEAAVTSGDRDAADLVICGVVAEQEGMSGRQWNCTHPRSAIGQRRRRRGTRLA